jgi:DNA-directed RNA polymerase subunit L
MSKAKSVKSKLLSVTDIEQTESIDNFNTNSLSFIINNTNYIFSNTIIRTIISLVGSFAFDKSDIEFSSDTSIFNRDLIRERINNIPIIYKDYMYKPIDDFAETCARLDVDRKFKNRVLTDIETIDELNKRKLSMINNIHMFVDAKNDTNDVLNVTTNSKFTTFHKDEKIIPDIYPRELKICGLKPGEEIKFSASASFNIPLARDCYSAAITTGHRELDSTTYRIKLISHRQMPEKQIVIEACKIIIIKINNIKNKLISKIIEMKSTSNIDYNASIEITNENHTMGEVLSRQLREHAFVNYAAFKMEHPDKNAIIFEYKVEGMTIAKILDAVTDDIVKEYQIIIDAMLSA